MKTFLLLTFLALLISLGIMFFVFPEPPDDMAAIREQYQQVFSTFERNAEDTYRQFDVYGLDILQQHHIEGLRIVKQYAHLLHLLQPYFPADALVSICRERGTQFQDLLDIYQPAAIAEIYDQIGEAGLRYILDQPNSYFLFQQYGSRLVSLVDAKGPIVLDVIKTYQPEFIELYYDDILFKAISRFGADGLLAIKTYRGMATTIFELFVDDERFREALVTYGYRQVIPVLYHFYTTKGSAATLLDQISRFELHILFQAQTASPGGRAAQDDISAEHQQFDRANWALTQISVSGHSFLRQFVISEDGNVTLSPFLHATNVIENIFLSHPSGASSSIQAEWRAEENVCQQFATVLDILGILPHETFLSKRLRCLYLQAGFADVRSQAGLQGLLRLEEHEQLLTQYGEAVIPFIAQYGREGIALLEYNDGAILKLQHQYGSELVYTAIKYGSDALTLTQEFGEAMLAAIQQTDGGILPYALQHGQETLSIIERPEGGQILALSAVYGEEILELVARYPEHFLRYLLKYGELAVKAVREHDRTAVQLAQQYGDEVIAYIGLYGEDGVRFAQKGMPGILLLRALPEELWKKKGSALFQYGLPGVSWSLLVRHPHSFHRYLGMLGETLFALPPYALPLAFWTLLSLFFLSTLRLIFRMIFGSRL